MTGYAHARRPTPWGELTASIKSVNHRGLDLHFHLGAELEAFEPAIRSLIKKHVARGHLDVRLSVDWSQPSAAGTVNRELLQSYVAAFREAAREYGISGEPDLNAALQIPGMLAEQERPGVDSQMEAEAAATIEEALHLLNTFRGREGSEIGEVLTARNDNIRQSVEKLESLRVSVLPALQARLKERLESVLGGAAVEPERIVQEAAILTDRSDIAEELARLKIHSQQLAELIRGGGEVGKKIDFLLQEMNRETNTLLSKTAGCGEAGIEITDLGLGLRADIEKIREQSLNLE